MEQGTGKTRTAIELIQSTDCDFVLFLCPFSTKNNLNNELVKWNLNQDYLILGYETLSASDRIYLETIEMIKGKRLFIVADESIFIKNEEAKRFNRVMHFASMSEYRLILNGTPVTKDEWDIYNQMFFLSPRIINMSRQEFLSTFFTKVQYKKKFERPKEFYKLSQVNIGYLHKLIEPYVFRVEMNFNKSVETQRIVIPASSEAKERYSSLKKDLLDNIANEEMFMDILVFMQYSMFTDVERCKQIAKKISGQTIVYCSFLEEVRAISSELDCYVITGATPENERVNILEQFKKDSKPLLMTFGVGSYGLNLQFCNQIAFASITFDYAKVEQAQARIKRLGQSKDIVYTYFTSDLGIYTMIENNLSNKQNLSELMISELKEVL